MRNKTEEIRHEFREAYVAWHREQFSSESKQAEVEECWERYIKARDAWVSHGYMDRRAYK